MHDEIYADAISEITLTGSVVRIDLVTLSASEKDEKNQPKPVLRQRIVMSVDGFLQSFSLMGRIMHELEQQGRIKRVVPGDVLTAGDVGVPPAQRGG